MEKQYHHGNLKIALIEAGIQLINKEGFYKLSLRKVAAMCQVSHAAPYSHFKNKDELFSAMQQHVAQQFVALFENVLKNNSQEMPDIIDKLGVAYVTFFLDHPEYFHFLFFQGTIQINLSIEHNGKDSFPAFQIFKDVAINVFKKFDIPMAQIEQIIIMKWSVVHGLASIATMKGVQYDKDWRNQIEALLCIQN